MIKMISLMISFKISQSPMISFLPTMIAALQKIALLCRVDEYCMARRLVVLRAPQHPTLAAVSGGRRTRATRATRLPRLVAAGGKHDGGQHSRRTFYFAVDAPLHCRMMKSCYSKTRSFALLVSSALPVASNGTRRRPLHAVSFHNPKPELRPYVA
jgi:hypothetical protein